MSIGGVRHVSDIKVTELCDESNTVLTLQSGTNKFSSQQGMNMGAQRHVSDIKVNELCQDGQGVLTAQTGMCYVNLNSCYTNILRSLRKNIIGKQFLSFVPSFVSTLKIRVFGIL